MKEKKEKPVKKPVQWPLFRLKHGGDCDCLWIVSKTGDGALNKALAIWKKRSNCNPSSVEIECKGTVDYIPQMKTPHWVL